MPQRFTTLLGAPGIQYTANGNVYPAAGSGLITGGYTAGSAGIVTTGVPTLGATFSGINDSDLGALTLAGAVPAILRAKVIDIGVIKAASATVLVASVAMSNGSLTVAASPDVPRQAQFVINPGAAAITAGILTLVYNNTQGVLTTDALSLITATSTALTLVSTQGVSTLKTAAVTALAGGSSPNIQGGTNGVIALAADVGQASLTVFMAAVDGVSDTLPTQSAVDGHLITPNTAPNGTHTYTFGYNFYSP